MSDDSIISTPPPEPGLYYGMPAEEYHAVESMSAGGAKRILQSAAHYKLMRTKKKKPTDAMQLGTAIHTGVLEPESFAKSVVACPDFNRRTNIGKADAAAFEAAHSSCVVLSSADFDRARRAIDAVRQHPGAQRLLDGATIEGSMFWIDARYKVPCKSRFDAMNHGGLVDLKSAADASPDGFSKAIGQYLYLAQAAHYCSGAEHVLDASPQFFAFIAVETEEPYCVACYTIPGAGILAGAHKMSIALGRYAEALATGRWQGYPDSVNEIALRKWDLQFNA